MHIIGRSIEFVLQPGDRIHDRGKDGFLVIDEGAVYHARTPLDRDHPDAQYTGRLDNALDCSKFKGVQWEHYTPNESLRGQPKD